MTSRLNRPGKHALMALVLVMLTVACSHWSPRVDPYGLPERGYTYRPPSKTGDGWKTASLSDVGVDSAKIEAMMLEILGGNDKNLHSVLLIKKGRLVLEEYFFGYHRDKLHYLASVSKSITSLAVGISIDRHLTPGVETKVYELFPEYRVPGGSIKNIRSPFSMR